MGKLPYIFISVGAILWGLIGLFVNALYQFGFSPLQIVTLRVTVAAVILLIYTTIKNPRALKLKGVGDIKYFLGTGILSIVFFNWCYFTAIREISLSLAVILLYTAPAFVVIISRIVFKDLLNPAKIVALAMTIMGCAFVVGLIPLERFSVSWYGFIVGLGSGLGYALYSIFGKLASAKYSSLTITTYTFLVASFAMLPASGLWTMGEVLLEGEVWLLALGLGFFPTVLAYILYTKGLAQVESSYASLTATIEPVVAVMIGLFIYQEPITGWQMIGIFSIILAIILVQYRE